MAKQTKYTLVATKIKGNVIPIEWTNIPCFNGGLDGNRLQTIDDFTSKFSDETELKDFILQYGEEIGLDKKVSRDKLADIIRNFLMKYFDNHVSDYDIRRDLSSLAESAGLSNNLKAELQKTARSGVDESTKHQVYEALIKRDIVKRILNNSIDPNIADKLIHFLDSTHFEGDYAQDLSDYAENSKLNYVISSFPLRIVYYNNRRLQEVVSGIAYAEDIKYIDKEYIIQYLKSAALMNDFELLNRLIKFYEKLPYQEKNLNGIRAYIGAVKTKSLETVNIPEWSINGLVNNEAHVYDETTHGNKLGRDGQPIIYYMGLRKLGMFISKYEKEKQKLYEVAGIKRQPIDELQKRLAEIPTTGFQQINFFGNLGNNN